MDGFSVCGDTKGLVEAEALVEVDGSRNVIAEEDHLRAREHGRESSGACDPEGEGSVERITRLELATSTLGRRLTC